MGALLGEHPIEGGELRLGASITTGYYRQDLSQVPLDRTLYDVIAELRPLWERGRIQGHLGRFGFSGPEVLRRADSLSGGERARLALAMLMLSQANLLVLDEPTNHLDVESIEALEDAIGEYADGTVILVSHDRELLRTLTTRLWVLHGRTDHRVRRRIRRMGGSERRAGARPGGPRSRKTKRCDKSTSTSVALSPNRAPGAGRPEDSGKGLRRAEREVADAERAVAALESQVAVVVAALEDPSLYTRAGGVAEARNLGAQLETLKGRLDVALERWTKVTEALEVSRSGASAAGSPKGRK